MGLLREKSGAEAWRAARQILELRRLIQPAQRWRSDLFEGEGVPVLEDAWQWNPDQFLLRDYYANSLLTFAEVKQRGWRERYGGVGTEETVGGAPVHAENVFGSGETLGA